MDEMEESSLATPNELPDTKEELEHPMVLCRGFWLFSHSDFLADGSKVPSPFLCHFWRPLSFFFFGETWDYEREEEDTPEVAWETFLEVLTCDMDLLCPEDHL